MAKGQPQQKKPGRKGSGKPTPQESRQRTTSVGLSSPYDKHARKAAPAKGKG